MAENLTVVARLKAKPGKENDVKQRLLALIAPTRKEQGCINYDLHESLDDKTLFVFYENWTSKAALDAHLQTPHVQAFLGKADELLAEPPDIGLYRMISPPAK